MGETPATRATDRLIAEYHPRAIVVLGIAGGIDKETKLCDVVVATTVQSYLDKSKAVPGQRKETFEFSLAGESYRTSKTLRDAIDNAEFANHMVFKRWVEDCSLDLQQSMLEIGPWKEKDLVRQEPQLICGPIASGPVVGAAEAFVQFLKSHDRKFLALEMESGGVLGATDDQRVPLPCLVIRGISDFGDNRKAEFDLVGAGAFRRLAMRNAIRLFRCAMDMGLFHTSDKPSLELGSINPPTTPSPAQSSQNTPMGGCSHTSVALRVESLSDIIDALKDHFGFEWEPASYRRGNTPIIFWPVRLRAPTPIHAAQTFAAAALQKHGAHVILCLDDLGNCEHTPEHFFATVHRWCRCVGLNDRFDERRFSQLLGQQTDPLNAWPIVQKWLGFTEERMLEVMRICKILRSEDADDSPLSVLASRRPRRLLTPAVIWTCLAQIRSVFRDNPIITLGGADERRLWRAWRERIREGHADVGHLYNASLGPDLHMSSINLAWDSHSDIVNSLTQDTAQSHLDWAKGNRMIPWCLTTCVALPDFVRSGCSHIAHVKLRDDIEPSTLILDLAKALESRLLSHA